MKRQDSRICKNSSIEAAEPICSQMEKREKQGSVLLLTLLVVSLLLMITLAFVVFVRMELRTVSLHQQRTQAGQMRNWESSWRSRSFRNRRDRHAGDGYGLPV